MKLHLDLDNFHGTAAGRATGVKITGIATIEDREKELAKARFNITGKIEGSATAPYRVTIELKGGPNLPPMDDKIAAARNFINALDHTAHCRERGNGCLCGLSKIREQINA